MNEGMPTAPRAAATLIVVRANAENVPEILLLKRGAASRFMPNAYVFAGGAVDGLDFAADLYRLCPDLDDAQASARLGLPMDGLSFYIAAIRECFEECGLLFAYDQTGDWVDLSAYNDAALHEIRSSLGARNTDLCTLCKAHGWRLAADRLWFYSHWITPRASRLRFDTCFFLAAAPTRQRASLANAEMSQLVWRTATDALAEHAQGRLMLMFPTRSVLREIAEFDDLGTLLDSARRRTGIRPYTPEEPGT
jgi:8-oxo-dGTP pyrophosphatase MutT (NUDIX family)